jgi:hypothetical protein
MFPYSVVHITFLLGHSAAQAKYHFFFEKIADTKERERSEVPEDKE